MGFTLPAIYIVASVIVVIVAFVGLAKENKEKYK